MNEINKVGTKTTQFSGIKPAKPETKTMQDSFKKMVKDVLKRAEREVYEYGDFAPVYEGIKNINKDLCPTEYMLKISTVPKGIENSETVRVLKLIAIKEPTPYQSERSILYGTKKEILEQLRSEDIYSKIDSTARKLSEDLSDL